MSTASIILLGAIAGLTIFLGLPMGRLRGRTARFKTFLNGLSAGVLLFLLLGLVFHLRPIAYVAAIKNAARVTGPLILQYPLYGGIMGIMTATGLAASLQLASTARSSAHRNKPSPPTAYGDTNLRLQPQV